MIKGLQGITGVTVSGGDTSVPYVNQNISNPMQGMIRVWGSDMQVFDGIAWMNMSTSYATVSLDTDTQDLLQWARNKRDEELRAKKLSEKYPAVANAFDELKKSQQQFNLVMTLSDEYESR